VDRSPPAPPQFQLLDQDGKKRKLAEFRGKWVVLYFYPRDDTPGCTVEACEFTEGVRGFTKLDAVVLGCSPDTPEKHRKFIAKYKLKLTLLSDPEREAMTAYGAWGEKMMYGKKVTGVIRSTVIVDPAGKVAHHWKKVKAKGHAESVRATLDGLQGRRERSLDAVEITGERSSSRTKRVARKKTAKSTGR
jgi:peroxiredoxin Q/BCP